MKSKKKSDKIDSEKIAKLLMAGILPEARLLDREEQLSRDLLVQRVKLGQEIGDIKRRVLSYLKREGINESLPKTNKNFSRERRDAIRLLHLDDERDLVLKTLMDRLEFLEKQCIPLENKIKERARDSDDVKIIMSIQGVDYYSAALYCSIVGDVNDYPTDDHLASYLGIIPVDRESAGVRKRGRMSKEGPSLGRWVLSVMADNVVRHNKQMKDYFLSAKKRKGSGKKARVLVMRKLERMTYFMLKNRENWKWENTSLTEAKISRLERHSGAVAEEDHNSGNVSSRSDVDAEEEDATTGGDS